MNIPIWWTTLILGYNCADYYCNDWGHYLCAMDRTGSGHERSSLPIFKVTISRMCGMRFFFTSDRFGQCNEPRITILVLNPWLVRSSEWRENISPAYLDIRDLLSGFVNQHNGWISFVGLQRRFISTECKTAFDTFAFEEPIHLIRSVVSR